MKTIKQEGSRVLSVKRIERRMINKVILLFVLFDFVLLFAAQAGGVEMTFVQGGTFKMGNQFDDMFEDELPVHDVTLSDFYIGTYEVTCGEWRTLMGVDPSEFNGNPNNPVENVSWFDAIKYCNKLSEKEGLTPCYTFGRNNSVTWNQNANGYRLPSEAEWEYAAKGGRLTKNYVYSGGSSVCEVAWYKDNCGGYPHVTGTKLANELGIYDMAGNVWEWCWDWYSSSYEHLKDQHQNPSGVEHGTERCRRGGGWHIISKSCRSSNRLGTPPEMAFNYVGFRVARNAK